MNRHVGDCMTPSADQESDGCQPPPFSSPLSSSPHRFLIYIFISYLYIYINIIIWMSPKLILLVTLLSLTALVNAFGGEPVINFVTDAGIKRERRG